jgi:hypothetical protein
MIPFDCACRLGEIIQCVSFENLKPMTKGGIRWENPEEVIAGRLFDRHAWSMQYLLYEVQYLVQYLQHCTCYDHGVLHFA